VAGPDDQARGDLRVSLGGMALITNQADGQDRWLVRWNRKWECYAFVGGHKHDDESFRECVIREITEELELACEQDFRVSEEPLSHLEFTDWSASAQTETAYTHELFAVALTGDEARLRLEQDERVRWITEDEIHSHFCADGKAVSATVVRLLDSIDWKVP